MEVVLQVLVFLEEVVPVVLPNEIVKPLLSFVAAYSGAVVHRKECRAAVLLVLEVGLQVVHRVVVVLHAQVVHRLVVVLRKV